MSKANIEECNRLPFERRILEKEIEYEIEQINLKNAIKIDLHNYLTKKLKKINNKENVYKEILQELLSCGYDYEFEYASKIKFVDSMAESERNF